MIIPDFFKYDVLLNNYTTYQVGGPAQYFAAPYSHSELALALKYCKISNTPFYIIGKGSNLVVSDLGYQGLIISLENLQKLEICGTTLKAQAGVLLWDAVTLSVQHGLAGLHNLIGIPGTIGGGVYINAGAFDQELDQTLTSVTSMDISGNIHTRRNLECEFGYRKSNFFKWNEVILEAEFALKKGNPVWLKEQMDSTWEKRKSKQPLEYPNAGSMFKRPPGSFAGKLIDEAGLKGHELGGAQISQKHSNFVINKNKACAQDIYDLSMDVILKVEQNSGIRLEREQIFLGHFLPYPRT